MKQNKYSKLPSEPVKILTSSNSPLTLMFPLKDGRHQKFDLTFLVEGKRPRPQIAKAFADVSWRNLQHYSSETRESIRAALRKFNEFLDWRGDGSSPKHITSTSEIDDTLLIDFQAYLKVVNREYKDATCAKRYLDLTRFLSLMKATHPTYLPLMLRIPTNIFTHQAEGHRRTTGTVISIKDLMLITEAATKEVEQIRSNHKRALELLESAAPNDAQARMARKPQGFWHSPANALYYLVRVAGIATRGTETNTALSLRNNGYPTYQKLVGWFAPTSEDYFIPFLVLLFLRTAINVTSIFQLRRDCLAEHPLPLGLTVVRFSKPRSFEKSKKQLSFPTNQHNGAIDLIRFLLDYTQPWVEHANKPEKNALFLYFSRTTRVRSAGYTFTSKSLSRFIARNNLPHFTFEQIRPTIATMVYLQTRDIFRVQRLLGHSSIRTTLKYIRGAIAFSQHDKDISDGINAMVEAVTGIDLHTGKASVFLDPVAKVVEAKIESKEISVGTGERLLSGGCRTFLGRCKDPFNSPQPGEIKGRVCRSLHVCLFCENCWIFAEDLVGTIRYRNSLEADKKDMSAQDWEELHGDAVREINEAILPSFPEEMVARAELEAKKSLNDTEDEVN